MGVRKSGGPFSPPGEGRWWPDLDGSRGGRT